MPKPHWTALALAVVLADGTLSAQDFAPGHPATLGAVRFSVPSPYTAAPELSDSSSAVYGNAATQTWVFVASLRRVEERQAVIRNLIRRFGSAVLRGDPDTLDWQLAPTLPTNLAFPFHQRLQAMGGPHVLDLSFVQLRSGGSDVLVGSAFILGEEETRNHRCGEWANVIALDAQYWVISSLLGRQPPGRTPFEGRGFVQVTWAGRQDSPPPQPADPEAARLIALYDAYAAANREQRRAAVAELMMPAVIEFYGDLRRLALHGSASEVRELPVLQRMQVLTLRHRFDAARLAGFDERQLFAISNEGAPDSLTAGTPSVHGNSALMNLRLGGRPTPWGVGFLRGTGGWSMDVLPLLATSGCLLRANLRRNGVSRAQEDSVIVQSIARAAGSRVADDVWQPMVRGGARPD